MFGFNAPKREPEPQANPRVKAGIYGMAALYLLYLCYKIVWSYLTQGAGGPSILQLVLGLVILGGGGIVVGFLAWKMHKAGKELAAEEPDEDEQVP